MDVCGGIARPPCLLLSSSSYGRLKHSATRRGPCSYLLPPERTTVQLPCLTQNKRTPRHPRGTQLSTSPPLHLLPRLLASPHLIPRAASSSAQWTRRQRSWQGASPSYHKANRPCPRKAATGVCSPLLGARGRRSWVTRVR